MKISGRMRTIALLAVLVSASLILMAQAQAPKPGAPVVINATARPTTALAAVTMRLEVEGMAPIAVIRLDSLSTQIEVVEYQDGEDLFLRKRPGRTKHGDLVVGIQPSVAKPTREWMKQVTDGRIARKSASLVFSDSRGAEIVRYNLTHCWPSRWEALAQDEKSGQWLETVQITTEEITRISP